MLKRSEKKQIRREVKASILETRGIFLYKKEERNKFKTKMEKVMAKGKKICHLIPSLFSPHGIWLNIGRNGGSFG